MELISFEKKKPEENLNIDDQSISQTLSQVNHQESCKHQFFGIINSGSKSTILVGPYDDEKKALGKLTLEVEKLMKDPITELIPNEDTAIIYQKIDDELFVSTRIDINEILDEGDEE